LFRVKDRTGIASEIFNKLAQNNVNIDMIIQNVAHDGSANIDFTVPVSDLGDAKNVVDEFIKSGDISEVSYDEKICKVSIVGVGMKSHTGVAAKAFTTMANENINIMMIATSEIKVSMVIAEKYAELAVRSLHDAYELDK
ncbi:MAG: ACT domain-containing protein, partial [Sulfurimonas sp.]|nr:ACT domain-containing protein [Sulfurimonas sp.]